MEESFLGSRECLSGLCDISSSNSGETFSENSARIHLKILGGLFDSGGTLFRILRCSILEHTDLRSKDSGDIHLSIQGESKGIVFLSESLSEFWKDPSGATGDIQLRILEEYFSGI